MDNKHAHIVMPKDHMDELYNSPNVLVKFVHRQRLASITKFLPKDNYLKVLDAGCGEGHLLEVLRQRNDTNHYYGVDVTDIALQKAKERCPFAQFELMDLANLPFEDEFFDVVIITEVLEHIYDYKFVLAELKRVLKKGGVLIITFPNEFWWTVARFLLGRRPIKVADHVNSFSPRSMKKALALPVAKKKHLPFGLPFSLSLGSIMKFRK